ncbi:hypothetical protein HOT99_gp211 [Caulobacter phage CcrBL10]|uniref:Uncharacterized protein n=1 Tax=Caulobacter phage CcrBL10 TaxID=2283269 RepID=A0A385E9K1_9CAUD|nr:hypothetical protein HOT99_gp211 [Caulobacter phage CcrBL10]AXQ68406.1 hypothetical protein CcrBL10_gp202c [Caulobacter phage CcrBL10]
MTQDPLILLRDWHLSSASIYGGDLKRFHQDSAKLIDDMIKRLETSTPVGHINLPTSVDEARMLALVGTNYLEEHAPDVLRKDPTGEIAAGRFALATVYAWMRNPGSHFPHGFTKIADAMKAFLAELPRGMRRFRHKKRGTDYALVGIVRIQCETPIQDDEILLTYIDGSGQVWGRREAEFMDGRFEEIKA